MSAKTDFIEAKILSIDKLLVNKGLDPSSSIIMQVWIKARIKFLESQTNG